MLGACPLISLDRLLAKNGPDFSQYATLQKPINLLMLASAILVKHRRNFFSSEWPGNVGGLSPDRPRSIARQKWSRFKPICHFTKIHKFADASISDFCQK
jgi:hypothetical protein